MSTAEAHSWEVFDGGKRKAPATKYACGCAACAAHIGRRTEATMTAQALAKLLIDGLIPTDAVRLAAACRSAGVAIAEVQAAWRIVDSGRYVKPEHLGQCRPDLLSMRHADSVKATNRYIKAHEGCPEGHKRCSRCGEAKPVEDFAIKDRRSGRRKSMCRDCMKEYQAERYVKIGYKAVMAEVLPGDPCVGHACPECQKPFEVGQVVVGERVVHFACSGDVTPDAATEDGVDAGDL